MKRIVRVFPRTTKATPIDKGAYHGYPGLLPPEADEIHISVAFSYDMKKAERLEKQWRSIAPVKIGGPGTGMKGGDFTPGMYLKPGYVITSRGCPNKCWFCSVWKREGGIRELPITEGFNIVDDNFLACSDEHIKAVFAMLKKQKQKIEFTGGLEAARLKPWVAEALFELKPKQLFFAYDTPDDLAPLKDVGSMLLKMGFTRASHSLRSFVLCGYPKDTLEEAEKRMHETIEAGFTPMAMLWRDDNGISKGDGDPNWCHFARRWARPAAIHGNISKQGALFK